MTLPIHNYIIGIWGLNKKLNIYINYKKILENFVIYYTETSWKKEVNIFCIN